jgi:hypothetical protein
MRSGRSIKSGIAIVVLSAVFALPSFARMDLDRVLGVWLLDEETGGKAVDASGHERDGKHQGAVEVIDGKFGKALELFGGDEGIIIPALGLEFPAANFTVTMWLRIDDWRTQQIYSMPVPGHQFMTFLVAPEKLIHFHAGDPVLFCVFRTDEAGWVDTWTHFAFVKNFVEEKAERYYALYINGVEAQRCGRVGSLLNETDGDLTFGGQGDTFAGAMDELAIFTEALGENEIKQIADRGLGSAVLAVDPAGKLTSTWASLKASD